MIEFKPKVKNKYNKLVSEYVSKISSADIKSNSGFEGEIVKVIKTSQGVGELKIKSTINKRSYSKSKLVSSRNRNYNNLILSENE